MFLVSAVYNIVNVTWVADSEASAVTQLAKGKLQ